ncbi:prepilin-type N-terminal cleavage/methylation domain-containing protein [Bacterioplanes sanyensis]|nr:prepilin-type N-terminal cleavage/methylation domain-containing protein [Bacterioplanes sanyensis]
MSKQPSTDGFTLIELIVVVVVLGVLAAFVVPRFMDAEREARVAVIEQVAGAMAATSALFHAQALIEGVEDGNVALNGQSIPIEGGYLEGFWNGAWRYVLDIGRTISFTPVGSECTANDLCGVGRQRPAAYVSGLRSNADRLVMIWPQGYRLADDCFAYYFNPDDGLPPQIGSITAGC